MAYKLLHKEFKICQKTKVVQFVPSCKIYMIFCIKSESKLMWTLHALGRVVLCLVFSMSLLVSCIAIQSCECYSPTGVLSLQSALFDSSLHVIDFDLKYLQTNECWNQLVVIMTRYL